MEKVLKELCYLLEDELKKIVDKQDLTPEELDNVNKALKVMIKTKEYEMMSGERPQGYSSNSGSNTGGSNNRYERPQGGYHENYGYRPQGYYDDFRGDMGFYGRRY